MNRLLCWLIGVLTLGFAFHKWRYPEGGSGYVVECSRCGQTEVLDIIP